MSFPVNHRRLKNTPWSWKSDYPGAIYLSVQPLGSSLLIEIISIEYTTATIASTMVYLKGVVRTIISNKTVSEDECGVVHTVMT